MVHNLKRWSAARGLYLALLSAVLIVAACGPSVAAPDDQGWTDVEGDTRQEEVAPSDSGPAIDVDPASQEVDAAGIQVGYTRDGFAYRGDPHAPILMEEYSDYQCPFCSRFVRETLPFIEQDQIASGELVLVFYDFPLPSHPQAPAAHQAAYCAGDEGAAAYWAMHDLLFDNLSQWSEQDNTTTLFSGYAQEAGLDVEQFRSCLDGGDHQQRVENSARAAAQRGVNSTPSFFINGQALTGAQPLETFNQAIETVRNGGILTGQAAQPAAPQPGVAPTPVTLNNDAAAALGNPDAAVTIVEFTDYECPFCARHSQQTLPYLIQQYIEAGEVYYVVKDFPLDNIHPQARIAAAAARCAGEQEAYWPMHDALFAGQPEWAAGAQEAVAVFSRYAADMGLDAATFEACLQSGRFDDEVEANFAEGRALGVSATPTFFINGYPVPGAQPEQIFDFAIGLAAEGRLAEAYVQPEPQPEPDPTQSMDVPLGDAPRIGDPDAPVVIIEYTDYQCPFCARHFRQTYPRILENYIQTGTVLYIFKDFPLTNIHPQAQMAAEAARCAGNQGSYLGMHDLLFERQAEWNNQGEAATFFTQYAGELDLDTGAFATCLENREHQAAVLADLDEGSALGIRGTPGFFINGYFLSGAQPYETFEQAIEELAADAN